MDAETKKRWMQSRVKHGAYINKGETPEHYTWRSMLARCRNKNSKDYEYYGAKGISVCKRWLSYENFILDMGNRPSADHSLDRINTKKGYMPSNCRWATRSEQQKNKSTTKFYSNGAFSGTLVECAKYIGISKELAHYRFKNWNTFERGETWRLLQNGL